MVKYKWIISPHGNGLECHRTYEAIALGCIPVVKSSTLDIMYKDMPIIILNDWNEISLELLKKLYDSNSLIYKIRQHNFLKQNKQ